MNRLQKSAANIVSAIIVVPVVLVVGVVVVGIVAGSIVPLLEGAGLLAAIVVLGVFISLKTGPHAGETLEQADYRLHAQRQKRAEIEAARSKYAASRQDWWDGSTYFGPRAGDDAAWSRVANELGQGDGEALRRANLQQAADDARRLADVQEAARRALIARRGSPNPPGPSD